MPDACLRGHACRFFAACRHNSGGYKPNGRLLVTFSFRMTATVVFVLTGGPALSQSPFTRTDSGDTILPATSYPLGESQFMAENMARNLRMRWIQEQYCWTHGCLIIANDSKSFDVRSYQWETVRSDGSRRWGLNLLDRPLRPSEGIMRIKWNLKDCERRVMFRLRQRVSKQEVIATGLLNICSTPKMNTVVKLRAVIPSVTILEGPEGD